MKLRNFCAGLVAAGASLGVASSAQALVWTSPNIADANTIALYHFDEGSGSAAGSSVSGRPNINLTANGAWSTDAGWLTTPSGSSLVNATATNGTYAGLTASAQSIDWGLPGITISFWMKDTTNLDQDNTAFYMGWDGWRNQQARFGYHTQWINAVLMNDGVGGPNRNGSEAWSFLSTIADGQWHHVGLVYDNAADTSTVYVDNVQQLSWSTAGGWSTSVSELMTVGNFGGRIDELLIQGGVVTDFSNGINVPEPTMLAMVGLSGLALMRRRCAV